MPLGAVAKRVLRDEHLRVIVAGIHQVRIRDVADEPVFVRLIRVDREVPEVRELPEHDRQVRFAIAPPLLADHEDEIRPAAIEPFLPDLPRVERHAVRFQCHVARGIEHHPLAMLVGPHLRDRMFRRAAILVRALMPPQRQRPIHPAQACRCRYEHLRVVRAEERVPFANRAEDAERAVAIRRRLAKLFELPVRPVQQQHLPLELILARRNHRFQPMPLAQLLQLGILECIELEPLRVVALHVGQRLQPPHGCVPPVQLDEIAGSQKFGRLCSRCQRCKSQKPEEGFGELVHGARIGFLWRIPNPFFSHFTLARWADLG